ncbi:MAG: hypothetical protein MHPSP_004632, partial [Paramarteilia canceri]
ENMVKNEVKAKAKNKQDKAIRRRWGGNIIDAGNGWTAVPNILIERQQALKIDPVKMNIILVLLKHWWKKDDKPYPGKKTIADIIGRDVDTVRKHLKQLEDRKLISREPRFFPSEKGGGQTTNEYNLQGLIDKLSDLSDRAIADDAKHHDDESRKRRGHV